MKKIFIKSYKSKFVIMDIDTIEYFINDTYIDSDEDETYDEDIHVQLLENLQGMIIVEKWKNVQRDVHSNELLSRMYQCQSEILDRLNMMDVDYSNRVMPDDPDEIIKDIEAHPLYHIFCEKIQNTSTSDSTSEEVNGTSDEVWKFLYHTI